MMKTWVLLLGRVTLRWTVQTQTSTTTTFLDRKQRMWKQSKSRQTPNFQLNVKSTTTTSPTGLIAIGVRIAFLADHWVSNVDEPDKVLYSTWCPFLGWITFSSLQKAW